MGIYTASSEADIIRSQELATEYQELIEEFSPSQDLKNELQMIIDLINQVWETNLPWDIWA